MAHNSHLYLNNAQKNSLTVTLRLLEERINSLKNLLNEQQFSHILNSYINDQTLEQRVQINGSYNQMLASIERIKEKFDLPVKTSSYSSYLKAFFGYFWALLLDAKTDKLVRYGEVAEELKEELDPLIDELIQQLIIIGTCQNKES